MWAAACVLAGVSAALSASSASGRARPAAERPDRRARARTAHGVAGRLSRICEQVGHRPLAVRAANVAPVSAALDRLWPALHARAPQMSRYGWFCACCLALVASCALCVLVSGSLLGIAVGVACFGIAASALAGRHESRVRGAASAQVPEALRALSVALAAGKSLPQAITHVGTTVGEPLGSEFLRASFEVSGGRSVDQAVDSLCSRVRAPGMELVSTALQVSQRTGGSLAGLLSRTARMVTGGVALRRELEVRTSQARLSARVVSVVPLVLVCVLVLLSPDYRAGLATGAGRACLCVAALMDLAALTIVRSMMRGVVDER